MEKQIKVSEKTAREIYPKAEAAVRRLLEESFGKDFFTQKITDRVKTFEDACEILGLNSIDVVDAATQDEEAYIKLKIIVEALNEGWTPDWNNSSEYKYYPWFDMRTGSGSSFAYYDYVLGHTYSYVGSRLIFKTAELAKYAGTQFLDIYKQYML